MHNSHFLYSYIYPWTSIYKTVSLYWLSKILLQLMWVFKCLFQTLQFSCAWICFNFARSFHPFLHSGYIALALYQECPKIQFFNSLLTFVSLLSIPWSPLDFLPFSLSFLFPLPLSSFPPTSLSFKMQDILTLWVDNSLCFSMINSDSKHFLCISPALSLKNVNV